MVWPGANRGAVDPTARAAYRRRIGELEEQLEEAEAAADAGLGGAARDEIEFLTAELGAAYGLGGRPRRATDDIERARKAVRNRIRESLDRIEREHAALGAHLRRALKTGTFSSYQPETMVDWDLSS